VSPKFTLRFVFVPTYLHEIENKYMARLTMPTTLQATTDNALPTTMTDASPTLGRGRTRTRSSARSRESRSPGPAKAAAPTTLRPAANAVAAAVAAHLEANLDTNLDASREADDVKAGSRPCNRTYDWAAAQLPQSADVRPPVVRPPDCGIARRWCRCFGARRATARSTDRRRSSDGPTGADDGAAGATG
jgi:hypothetical protein